MGVVAVLTLVLKQMWRGRGLKVCIIASLMLVVLIQAAGDKVPAPVLVGIVLPASASSLIIDFRAHYSMLRALYMVGATPRQVRTYMLVPSMLLSAIYGMPYVAIGITKVPLVFLLALVSSVTVMVFALRVTKRGFSTSIAMYTQ